MAVSWVVVATSKSLDKVQADLNVVLTALGIMGIWAFGRFCRQSTTAKILFPNRHVQLPALLNISGLGSVLEVVLLLRHKLFTFPTALLLAQCIVVVFFTVMTLISGLLANISLQRGSQVLNVTVPGLLANAHGSGYTSNEITANVVWNLTHQALDNAKFPMNQLLDFLPDSSVPWVYQEDQWNSTWRISCNEVDHLPVDLGEPSKSVASLRNLFGLFPEAYAYFPSQYQDKSAYRLSTSACGSFDAKNSELLEAIYYVLFTSEPTKDDNMYKNNQALNFSLGAVGVEHAPFQNFSPSTMNVQITAHPKAAFLSRVDCTLTRSRPVSDVDYTAWPWTNDTQSLITAYADYHRWNSIASFMAGDSSYLTSTQELISFYQVYNIMKDVWEFSAPVHRKIGVVFPTVEISVASLVIICCLWAAVLFASLRYAVYWIQQRHKLDNIPDSTLDWMIHASNVEEQGCEVYVELTKAKKFSTASYEQLLIEERPHVRVSVCKGFCCHASAPALLTVTSQVSSTTEVADSSESIVIKIPEETEKRPHAEVIISTYSSDDEKDRPNAIHVENQQECESRANRIESTHMTFA